MVQIFPMNLRTLAETVIAEGRKKSLCLTTAESCTGGLISGCLTEVPGSSDVFDRGFVVYSYDSKEAQLGVSRATLTGFGAVSAETVLEMAKGALNFSKADIAVAVTGIAGPGGGMPEKPVGLVYLGVAVRKSGKVYAVKNIFTGDRGGVRLQTVEAALQALLKEINNL
jgi:nicotinamide-nucleotide amidase